MVKTGIRAHMIAAAGVALVSFVPAFATVSPQLPTWYFGEGLRAGDYFEYKICDSILKIPQSSQNCYVVKLWFLMLLPTPEGETWVTAAKIIHKNYRAEAIFHVLDDSKKIKTDGMSMPYAESAQRTLGWINQYASKFEPQALSVGKSWGTVLSDAGFKTELLVTQKDTTHVANKLYETHRVGYSLFKESSLQISDEFPFPLKAVVYQAASRQNQSPAFTVELLSHSHNACESNGLQNPR